MRAAQLKGVKESLIQFGNFCDGGRALTRGLVDGNQRGECGNFNLFQPMGGFRNENAATRRNAEDISDQLHFSQGGNETNQVTVTRMMAIISEQFQSIRGQNEGGKPKPIILEKQNGGTE